MSQRASTFSLKVDRSPSLFCIASSIISAITFISSSSKPLVVTAAVPILIPDVTNGLDENSVLLKDRDKDKSRPLFKTRYHIKKTNKPATYELVEVGANLGE